MATSNDLNTMHDNEEIIEVENIFTQLDNSSSSSVSIKFQDIFTENFKENSEFLPIYKDPFLDDYGSVANSFNEKLRNGLNTEMTYLERKEILNNSQLSNISITSILKNSTVNNQLPQILPKPLKFTTCCDSIKSSSLNEFKGYFNSPNSATTTTIHKQHKIIPNSDDDFKTISSSSIILNDYKYYNEQQPQQQHHHQQQPPRNSPDIFAHLDYDDFNSLSTKTSSVSGIPFNFLNTPSCCLVPKLFNQSVTSPLSLFNDNLNSSNSLSTIQNDRKFHCQTHQQQLQQQRRRRRRRRQQNSPDIFAQSDDDDDDDDDDRNNDQQNNKMNYDDDKCNDFLKFKILRTSMKVDNNYLNTDVDQILCNQIDSAAAASKNYTNDLNTIDIDDTAEDCLKKRRKYLIECIQVLIKSLIKNYKEFGDVTLLIDNTSNWDNLEIREQMVAIRKESVFRNLSLMNQRTQFRFTLINYLLNEILKRLLAEIGCTLRELYYQDPELCQDQLYLTKALHNICCLLKCTPWELGIYSSSKGLIAGSLLMAFGDHTTVDCSAYQTVGFLLPKHTAAIEIIDCNAEFILLVEKETVFERLLQQKIFQKISKEFILITGKGYPDINTRLILRKILNKFNIPVYALMDADPYGIEIMLIYCYGSKELSYMSKYLACPEIQWIGVLPSEIDLLAIPSIPLTNEDKIRITDLLKRPYMTENIIKELKILLEYDRKAEIEGILSFSFNFLVNNYIPNKIH